MRELILHSARLRLPRLLLLALGAALITAGLSYLAGTLQQSQAEVSQKLEDRWRVSYDILVRPPQSPETESFFTPGQLTGAGGGISLEQWQQIKAVDGVEVAAPVTQVGWVNYPVSVSVKAENGLYRIAWEQTQSDGLQTYTARGTDYTWIFPPGMFGGSAPAPALFTAAGIRPSPSGDGSPLELSVPFPIAVVAVNAGEEARLLGLDQAVTGGTYFGPGEHRPMAQTGEGGAVYSLPVLVSGAEYGEFTLALKLERLGLPAAPSLDLLRDLKTRGGRAYLEQQPGTQTLTWRSQPGRLGDVLMGRLDPSQIQTWWTAPLLPAPAPPIYGRTGALDAARWPDTFKAEPAGAITPPDPIVGTAMMAWRFTGVSEDQYRRVRFHSIGAYDPARIQLPAPADPSAALYRMGAAELAFDAGASPVAQPAALKPLAHPHAYLTSPPVLITTLEAAQPLLPGAPIGLIRVRVAAVEQISDRSIARVDQVAKAIAAATGLKVDIMRGAAPEPVLVQLPGSDPSAGYFAQTWLHKGQAIQMFRELGRGDALVLGLVLLVGVVFVVASSIVHVMLRQRELSTLAAVGWRARHLLLLVLAEAGLVALAGGLAAALAFPRVQTLAAALGALLLYVAGATLATLTMGISTPLRLMRGGGVTPYKQLAHVENLRQIAWGSLWARRRNLLSLSALVLPTALLVVLTALTLRLEDRFFVTVLGAQIALQVGPFHYAMMVAAFALAAATTADLMSLSVLERRSELALLSAMGWPRKTLRALVLWEGVLWGLTAGLAGALLGLGALYLIYGRVQTGLWAILPLILAVPTITGLIGAIAPAESAARMEPARGVKAS